MKLALSALLLSSTALAAPLFAQSAPGGPDAPPPPPPPGMHHGGPRGPHGPMMFGPAGGAHRVEPIANAPFTAKFTETSSAATFSGTSEQHNSTSTVYRDSQGRVREEVTLPPAPPPPTPAAASGSTSSTPATPRGPRTIVTILDPVAHTVTHLDAERKTAFVQPLPADFLSRMQQREQERQAAQATQMRDNVKRSDLGNKVIAGVSAKGERTVITFPSQDGGAAHTRTHETWISQDAKFEVGSSDADERMSHTDTLTTFTKGEPDASLFKVPAGYTTQTAPERHHGHGPEGPGGPGNDAPAPPSAM